MNKFPSLKKTLLQFSYLLLILSFCRLAFLSFNLKYYPSHSFIYNFYLLLIGLRFDLTTIIYCNLVYLIVYVLISARLIKSGLLLRINNYCFVIINVLIILINIVDIVYYRFIYQRSSYVSITMALDSLNVIAISAIKFWNISLLGVLLTILFVIGNQKILNHNQEGLNVNSGTTRFPYKHVLLLLTLMISARGLNTFPLTPSSANLYVQFPYVSIVSNSAFDILTSTIRHNSNIPVPRFSQRDSIAVAQRQERMRQGEDSVTIQKRNVIIFLLESFSRSYLAKGNEYKAHTPFLDSIMQKSVVCTNAFANGVMSINGLNAVIGGIPAIAFQTLTTSPYQNNIGKPTGDIFENLGYSTHFFFGSNDDHYGFKRLVRQYGITNYYGKDEFGNNKLDDGIWGIYDMPFFEYAAGILGEERSPLFAVIFNLSSHFPYTVPEPYKSTLPGGPLNSSQSISYVDKSIASFFQKIKKEKWFNNTLFVFVADHWSHEDNAKEEIGINRYSIPLFFYSSDQSLKPRHIDYVCDQLDVIPTIMDILGISKGTHYLGKSVFDTSASHFSCSMLNFPNIIQLTNDSLTLQFDISKDQPVGLYLYKQDINLKNNLETEEKFKKEISAMERTLKEYLLAYYSIIKNENKLTRTK